jgi:hypothetical protein
MPRSKSFHLGQLLGQNSTIEADKLAAGAGGGSVTSYATAAALPLSGNTTCDQAFVSETGRLYIWTGAGWYNIALINTNPTITSGADASYSLNIDGTPTVITLVANDPEGLPITWSYAVTTGSLSNGGGNTATVTQVGNEFTITPSTTEAYEGVFEITFTVSDGVNLATSASTFSLAWTTPTVEYLVVAGGGGGGAAGAGAGGLLSGSVAVDSNSIYTVTVGAGGTGNAAAGNTATNGGDSVFGSISATGGGYGMRNDATVGSGGSGGGGWAGGSSILAGSGISGQGNAGGLALNSDRSGGGGGAGAAGGVGSGTVSGNGGAGITSAISGTSITYAGGGGGGYAPTLGVGGVGGGGNGTNSPTQGGAGTANTGGGGGGGEQWWGGDGGSGIVIIRYADIYQAAASTTGSPTITVAGGYRVYTFTQSGSITF